MGSARRGLVVDLFAGGGGASTGLEAVLGRPVDVAVNHDAVALAVHAANHPGTRHLVTDVWEVSPRLATGGRKVDVLWASPDCTQQANTHWKSQVLKLSGSAYVPSKSRFQCATALGSPRRSASHGVSRSSPHALISKS